MLPSVIRLGSRYTPRRSRLCGTSVALRCGVSMGLSLAQALGNREHSNNRFAADYTVADRDAQLCRCGQKHVHARAELHDAEALPCLQLSARGHPADDASGENADNLPENDREAVMLDPHFAALVGRGGSVM